MLDPGSIVPGVYRERDMVAYHRGIIVGFPKLYSLISGFSQISTQDSSKYKIQLREILKTSISKKLKVLNSFH